MPKKTVRKKGEWKHYAIEVHNGKLSVFINGKSQNRATLDFWMKSMLPTPARRKR